MVPPSFRLCASAVGALGVTSHLDFPRGSRGDSILFEQGARTGTVIIVPFTLRRGHFGGSDFTCRRFRSHDIMTPSNGTYRVGVEAMLGGGLCAMMIAATKIKADQALWLLVVCRNRWNWGRIVCHPCAHGGHL